MNQSLQTVYSGAVQTLFPSLLAASSLSSTVSSGEISSGCILESASMDILSGGTAVDTALNSKGTLRVKSGGTALDTAVNSAGTLYVSSFGFVSGAAVNSGGRVYVSSGGVLDSASVDPCGSLFVRSSATATSILENGGYVSFDRGASVTFLPNSFSGLTLSSKQAMSVHSGTTASEITLSSGASMRVSSGGTATAVTASEGAFLGIAVTPDTYVQGTSAGSAFIVQNACVSAYILNTGYLEIFSGALASGITINSACSMTVFSGGTANSATISSGGRLYVSSGAFAADTLVKAGACLDVFSGGAVSSTALNASGWLYVSSGGFASATTVNSKGNLMVSSGGTALDTTLQKGGLMYVNRGATATIRENGGYVYLYNGADVTFVPNSFSKLTLSAYCSATVHSGTTATGLKVNSRGYLLVYSGGTATSIKENGGYVSVADGADFSFAANSFSGVIVSTYESATVHSGTTATGTTIESAARMYVFSGGIADNTVVESGAHFDVASGGTATAIKENGGYVSSADGALVSFASNFISGLILMSRESATVHSGTTATDTTVAGQAVLHIFSGGTATGIIARSGAYLGLTVAPDTLIQGTCTDSAFAVQDACIHDYTFARGWLAVSSGGTAADTSVSFLGELRVSSGGSALDTAVSSGGQMHASAGAVVSGLTVESGGCVTLNASANLAGTVSLNGTMSVTGAVDASSACIDFALYQRTTTAPCMLSGIDLLTSASYGIIVSAEQSPGIYQIATASTDFQTSMNIRMDSGKIIGPATAESQAKYFNTNYILQWEDSALSLQISDDLPAYVNSGWLGLSSGTVVDIPGGTATIGTDAFADESSAISTLGRYRYLTMLGSESGNLSTQNNYLEFRDMLVGGTIFAGVSAETKQIAVTGTTAKRFFAGGIQQDVTRSDGTAAEITAKVSGGSFGGFFGGGDTLDAAINANTDLTVSDTVANLLFGGANLKLGSADHQNTVSFLGDTLITLSGVTSSQYTCGGSLIGSYSTESRTGDISLNISGGSFTQLIGGSLIQSMKEVASAITGDINIFIGGSAKIGTLYGGSFALKVGPTRQESIMGNVNLTIDVSEGAAVSGKVFCGGAAYASVDGNVNLTIKGAGQGSDFFGSAMISCDSSYAKGNLSYVTGDRAISFSNFNGICQSNIFLVDTVNVDATSEVTLTYLMSHLNSVNWNISADDADRTSVTLAESSLGEFAVDFAGSVMHLSCALEDGDEWTVFKTAGNEILSNLNNATIDLNGDLLTETDINLFSGDLYQLEYRDDGTLIASKLA